MKKLLSKVTIFCGVFSGSGFVIAQGDVVTLSTTVKGNQEHPSVTYIVPWRQASDDTPLEMPFNTKTRLGDVFEHVERAEHERQVDFLTQMQAGTTTAAE